MQVGATVSSHFHDANLRCTFQTLASEKSLATKITANDSPLASHSPDNKLNPRLGIMFGTKMTFWITTVAIGALLFVGWKLTARGNYETAAYQLLDSEGPFELRDYPEIMLVTTDMATASNGNDGSFGRLFQYISGSNERGQKVKMTTPVFMESDPTEPTGTMGFVIPQKVVESSIPNPTGSRVEIEKRTAGRYAVMRFNGRLNERSQTDSEAKLIEWIKLQGWEREEKTEFAGYDPPWTPRIFRRNETLIRLK